MEILWVIYDDTNDLDITNETPMDGYLFFYETSPLKLSKEFQDRLSNSFAVPRKNLQNFLSPESAIPNDTYETTNESLSDMDPDDFSVNFVYSRNEVLEKLKSLNVSFSNRTSTALLNDTFNSKLKQMHPIHEFLKKLEMVKFKDIANKIKMTYYGNRKQMSSKIAKYFLTENPNSPLTSLKKCIFAPAAESEPKVEKKMILFLNFSKAFQMNE